MGLPGSAFVSTCSPTLVTPVVEFLWVLTRFTSRTLLLAAVQKASASTIIHFRSCHVHHSISALMFRCLRFVTFVTASNARLTTRWGWLPLSARDSHPQDKYSFAWRTEVLAFILVLIFGRPIYIKNQKNIEAFSHSK